MPPRGRKPTPTNLHILHGNPGKRALNKNEPKLPPRRPHCPQWLNKEARKLWRWLIPQLEKMGILTEANMMALAGLCQSYARWREAEEFIEKHGTVFPIKQKNAEGEQVIVDFRLFPQVNASRVYFQQVRLLCNEFGLTPSAVSRLSVNPKKEIDEFEEFLNRGKDKKATPQ